MVRGLWYLDRRWKAASDCGPSENGSMELTRVAGLVMIAGFGLFVSGFSVGPPRIFEETELEARLWIIGEHPSRWKLVMWLGGLQPLVTAFGFLLLSVSLLGRQSTLLLAMGAASFIVAGVFVAAGIRGNIANPGAYLDRASQSPQTVGYLLLTALAGIIYGMVFLRADLPDWLGYITLGSAALVPLLAIFKSSVAYSTIMAFYFVTFVVGFVLLGP